MNKLTTIANNFTSGELSPFMLTRTDLEQYKNGAKAIENFLIMPTGGVRKRPGFKYIGKSKYPDEFAFGAEKITNGTFTGSATPWHLTDMTYASNAISKDIGEAYGLFYQDTADMVTALVDGEAYRVSITLSNCNLDFLEIICGSDYYKAITFPQNQTYTYDFTYNSSASELLWFRALGKNKTVTVDNISLTKIDAGYTGKTRLIPFQFNVEQAYMMEFGHEYIRFYMNKGQIVWDIDDVTDWITSTAYVVGDFRKTGGVIYRCLIAHTSGTFATDLAAGDWVATDIYEIVTPYSEDDLFEIQYKQNNDVLTINHPDYKTRKLSRIGHTNWTLTTYAPTEDPFLDADDMTDFDPTTAYVVGDYCKVGNFRLLYFGGASALFVGAPYGTNTTGKTIAVQANTGDTLAVTYTSGAILIKLANTTPAKNTGALIQAALRASNAAVADWYVTENLPYSAARPVTATITAVSLTTCNKAYECIVNAAGDANNTAYHPTYYTTYWIDQSINFPTAVCDYEQREFHAGTYSQPNTIWGTVSGDSEDMTIGAEEDDALEYTMGTSQANGIRWIFASYNGIVIGTAGGLLLLNAGDFGEPLTPLDATIKPKCNIGTAKILPVQIGNFIYYVHRDTKRVMEYSYNGDTDSYQSNNMNILSEHLSEQGIKEIAYQQSPYNMLWAVRDDGVMITMTRLIEHKITAWARQITDGDFESVAVIPTDSDDDEVWAVVKRGEDRFTEVLEPLAFGNLEDAFFVDSGLTYDSTPATTISGLDHLIGKEVAILADGVVLTPQTVDGSGEITLATAASVVHAGLAYDAILGVMPAPLDNGVITTQGKVRKITEIKLRLWESLNCSVGYDEDNVDVVSFDAGVLYTGYKEIPFNDGYTQTGEIYVVQTDPLPLTILAVISDVTIE